MATPQLSPGVLVREVDLTVGRADNVFANTGGICAPFVKGPVNQVVDVTSEQDLLNVFGKPISSDRQYEWWLTASAFLSYGGRLKVVRIDGDYLKNSIVGTYSTAVSVKITNYDEYNENYLANDEVDFLYASKNPGTWANGLKICTIDNYADQKIGLQTSNPNGSWGLRVGDEIFKNLTNVSIAGAGATSSFTGKLRGIVVGINSVTTSGASGGSVDVKLISRISSTGVETPVDYIQSSTYASFLLNDSIGFAHSTGGAISVGVGTVLSSTTTTQEVLDWYNTQTLDLTNDTIYWKNIAPKPKTTSYCLDRGGKNDEIHVVVVDDLGTITGTKGSIIEKFVGLSKATDAISQVNSPAKNWYKKYLANFSSFIYAGTPDASGAVSARFAAAAGISTSQDSLVNGVWNSEAQGINFNVIGNQSYSVGDAANPTWSGLDYAEAGEIGQFAASLGALNTGYTLFDNEDEHVVDYLIAGPGPATEEECQSHAINLISLAGQRKDCLACVSPNRAVLLGDAGPLNTYTQTNNIIKYYGGVDISSSYGVLDSGWKYTYDRFNNQFVYIPCNGDVAGLMVRTSIEQYPWYSPAGQQRGVLNNAIKLAYNPSKSQRDQIYPL